MAVQLQCNMSKYIIEPSRANQWTKQTQKQSNKSTCKTITSVPNSCCPINFIISSIYSFMHTTKYTQSRQRQTANSKQLKVHTHPHDPPIDHDFHYLNGWKYVFVSTFGLQWCWYMYFVYLLPKSKWKIFRISISVPVVCKLSCSMGFKMAACWKKFCDKII